MNSQKLVHRINKGALIATIVFAAPLRLLAADPCPEEVVRTGLSFCLKSPLAFDSIEDLVTGILNIFVIIATPIIVMFIIYAGFLYVTARGNAEQVSKATTALTYSIVGAVILLGAVALSAIIGGVVASFR